MTAASQPEDVTLRSGDGADLANLVNEAALLAARRDHDRVAMADFNDSLEKVVLGTVRGIVLSPAERERTAYHESGHALLSMLTPGADPGPPDLHHPPRSVPRCHLPGPRRRPVRLLHVLPARPDHRRPGRARLRGGRLRRGDHRRRKRHGPRQPDRPADGGPLGHVTGHRADHSAPPARPGITLRPGRRRPGHKGTGRHRSPPDHRGMLPAGPENAARQPEPAGPAGARPPPEGNPGRGRGLRRGRRQPRHRPPPRPPRAPSPPRLPAARQGDHRGSRLASSPGARPVPFC